MKGIILAGGKGTRLSSMTRYRGNSMDSIHKVRVGEVYSIGGHNELDWLPATMFKDGIQKTIQWYLDNKEWRKTIISGVYQN